MPSPFTLRYKLGLSQRDTNTAVRDAGRAMSDGLRVPRATSPKEAISKFLIESKTSARLRGNL